MAGSTASVSNGLWLHVGRPETIAEAEAAWRDRSCKRCARGTFSQSRRAHPFLATFADALLTGRIVTGFPNLDDPSR